MINKKEIHTLIVLGGRMEKDFALSFILSGRWDKIIAVDDGLHILHKLKVTPTDIVGDFDTVDPELLMQYKGQEGIRIRRFQPQKDDTDSEIAVRMAIEYGSNQIDIIGGTGNRLDHTIGNIRLLGQIYQAKDNLGKREGFLYDKNNRVRLVGKECVIRKEEEYGEYVSLFPFTQTVTGITLDGFQYPLTNATMDIFTAPTLGISNEIIEKEGKITCREGVLLVIESMDKA